MPAVCAGFVEGSEWNATKESTTKEENEETPPISR